MCAMRDFQKQRQFGSLRRCVCLYFLQNSVSVKQLLDSVLRYPRNISAFGRADNTHLDLAYSG